jgi:hypothetical protein
MNDSPATLGVGIPRAKMENQLEPAALHSKTVGAPKDMQPFAVTEIDSRVLEGSHGVGDHRGEAAAVNPLAGNDVAPRETQGADGLGA